MNIIGRQVYKEIDRATWKPASRLISDCTEHRAWDLTQSLLRFEVEQATGELTTPVSHSFADLVEDHEISDHRRVSS